MSLKFKPEDFNTTEDVPKHLGWPQEVMAYLAQKKFDEWYSDHVYQLQQHSQIKTSTNGQTIKIDRISYPNQKSIVQMVLPDKRVSIEINVGDTPKDRAIETAKEIFYNSLKEMIFNMFRGDE